MDPLIDSYSGFFDNGHRKKTELDDLLKAMNIKEIFVAGLATDYCVRYTALDAIHLGYKVHVIPDACRGVELNPGDVEEALREISEKGGLITPGQSILRPMPIEKES